MHFLMKIHVFEHNTLNCTLYLKFNVYLINIAMTELTKKKENDKIQAIYTGDYI